MAVTIESMISLPAYACAAENRRHQSERHADWCGASAGRPYQPERVRGIAQRLEVFAPAWSPNCSIHADRCAAGGVLSCEFTMPSGVWLVVLRQSYHQVDPMVELRHSPP